MQSARTDPPLPPEAASPAAASRAALVLWLALLGLALARALLAFPASTWLWGLHAQRFLAPVPAWAPWALLGLALVPPVARPLARGIARLGDAIALHPRASALGWAAGAALLAWILPDRVHFTGDFQLRLDALEAESISIGRWTPVALPLDLALHQGLVKFFHDALTVDWSAATRVLGALEAALLGALATRFARALGLRGAPAASAAAIVLFGGSLTLFTGYDKSFMELTLLTAVVGIAGIQMLREGRGAVPLGLAAAAGFALHRSSLALIAGVVAAWALAPRRGDRAGAQARGDTGAAAGARVLREGKRPAAASSRREPGAAVAGGRGRAIGPAGAARWAVAVPALVLPLAVLAAMAPLMLAAFRQFDPVHVAAAGTPGGIVAAVFAPQHLLDLANLVLQLSPLAIAAPVLLVLDRSWRRREGLFLLALLAPYVAAMLIVHPYQGVFRDVDDFAAAGMALSLLTAWLTARALAAAPARAWLSAAIVLGVAAPAVQWMLLSADLERGLARVHAFATEAPRRSDLVIGQTWDFLGMRYIKLRRWSDGARALEQAARYAPSSRILTQWAICEMRRGNTAAAHSLFERVLEKKPDDYFAWHELAATSLALGRLDRARHAASELLRLDPSDPTAPVVLQEIARREQSTGAPGR